MKIVVVFKTHFDIGYTELAKEVIDRYSKKMLSDVIKTCEETKYLGDGRKYVWTMSSWPLKKTIEKGLADEEKREKAIALIEEGQISWHALPFTTHTEFCGLEELIKGIRFSTELSKEYGYYPLSAKMTDVPGHTYILPTLLAGAGIKFLHLGCNPGCMSPDVPRLFWWEGPDGSRVLTFYSKGAYGSDCIPPADWEYPVWLAMLQTNDNIGPQDASIIGSIEESIYGKYPKAEITVGTMDDFYNAIIEYSPDIPVIKKDLADSWIHGVGTYPKEVKELRQARKDLLFSEKLMAYNALKLRQNDPEDMLLLESANENSLLFGEHTWGLDVKTHMGGFRHYDKKNFQENLNSPIYKYMEESWQEQSDRASFAKNAADTLLNKYGKSLAENIDYNGKAAIVFNPYGNEQSMWVAVQGDYAGFQDLENGKTLKMREAEGLREVFVQNIPAFGYKTIVPDEKFQTMGNIKITQNDDVITTENSFYKITVELKSGSICSLFDKIANKEWVDQESTDRFAAYRYDVYGLDEITEYIRKYSYRFFDWLVNDLGRIGYPNCEHKVFKPVFKNVKVVEENGSASIIIMSEGQGESVREFGDCKEIVTTITLFSDDKEIKINFKLNAKEKTSMVEAVHFVFPLLLERANCRINKLGSVIDSALDIEKDANHALYCLENWVDINNGSNGLTIIAHDTPLFSIGDEAIYKFNNEFKPSKPHLHFNAFNNQWGTNFPQWTGGDFSFDFSLFTHSGDWQEGEVVNTAQSMTHKAKMFTKETGNGSIPLTDALITTEDKLTVSLFTQSKYHQNCFLLRLRECNGEKRNIKITVKNLKSVKACDLQERIIGEIKVINDTFFIEAKPFSIYSYIIDFE